MSQMPEDGSSPYGDLPYAMAGLRRKSSPYDRQRQYAYSLMQGGMDTSPIAHPMQGVSRLAQALVGSLMANRADSQEAEAQKAQQEAFGKAAQIADPNERLAAFAKLDPEMGMRYGAQMAMQEAALKRNAEMFQNGGAQIAAGYGMQPPSGGQGGGFTMPPEQAKATAQQYAQYLVQNHGMSPEQATAMVGNLYQESGFNPSAVHDNGTGFGMGGWRLERRDALLNAAKQAGKDPRDPQFQLDFYANELKGRPEFAQFQAAQTPQDRQTALMTYFRPAGWTPQNPQAGNGFANRVQFAQTFAGGPQVVQGSADGGLPVPRPPGAVADASGNPLPPANAQPPAIPDVPRPQPSPQIIQQAQAMYSQGMFGKDPQAAVAGARQWVEQQVNDQWTRDRERARMEYDQKMGDYKDARARSDKAPQEQFQNANTLRKEYSSEPVVKQFREVVPIVESAQEAVNRPTRAADLNLIYALGKVMDPNSVVREGEMVMARGTGTVQDTINGLLGQLDGSPTLKPETRQKLVAEIMSRYQGLKASHDQISEVYTGIAKRNGLPVEDVIIPIRPTKPAGEQGGAPAVPGSGGAMPPPPPGFRPVGGR